MLARTGFRARLGRGMIMLALLASTGLIGSSALAGTMPPSGAPAGHPAVHYQVAADRMSTGDPCDCQAQKELIDLVQRVQGESHEQAAILSYYADQVTTAKQQLQQAREDQSRTLSNNFASGAATADQ